MLPPSSPAQLRGIQLIHCYFLEYRLILCFLLLVHRIPMPLRQLKRVLCKLGLKRRVTRYSVRHLQQVEELIRIGYNYICSTTVTVNVSHCLFWRMSFMDQEYFLVVGWCVIDWSKSMGYLLEGQSTGGLPTLSNSIWSKFCLTECEKVPFGLTFVQLTLDHTCNNKIWVDMSAVWSDTVN